RALGAAARRADRGAAPPRRSRPARGAVAVPDPAGDHRPGREARRAHRPRRRGRRAAHVGLPALPALADAREVLRLPGPGVPALPRGLSPGLRRRELPLGPVPRADRSAGAAAARDARSKARGRRRGRLRAAARAARALLRGEGPETAVDVRLPPAVLKG